MRYPRRPSHHPRTVPRKRETTVALFAAEFLEYRRLFSTLHSLASLPQLSSYPAAYAQLFLDFDGDPATTWNGQTVPATPAYNIDGDPTTCNDQELQNISEIWSRVAEIYSPFNINVTTVTPSDLDHGHTLHVIIGGNGSWSSGDLGGTSSVNSFQGSFAPNSNYIFSSNLSSPLQVAEVAAHESGHSFGLYHQSSYSGGTLVNEYNPGTAQLAPIMGNPLSAARATWWHGTSIISSTTIQDDMSVISNSWNHFGYRPDDHGNTIAAANALALSGNSVSASGIIEQTTDSDVFSFTTGAGAISLNVNVAQYGPMLHAQAVLKDAGGNVVASAANANTLGQTISTTVSAGTYYLFVQSFGQYGDVGQYTISGTIQPVAPPPTFAIAGPSTVNEQSVYTLSLSANDSGNTVSGWALNWGDGNIQNVTGNPSSVTHTYAAGPHSWTISATASDGVGTYAAGNNVAVTVAHVAPTLTLSGAASVNEGSVYTLNLAAVELAGHAVANWSINWGGGNIQFVAGNPSSITHTYPTGPNSYSISATATDDVGTYTANTLPLTVNDVAPVISVSGAASATEGAPYSLTLGSITDPGTQTVTSWIVHWGDGLTDTYSTGGAVIHTYATGPATENVVVDLQDQVGLHAAAGGMTVSVLHAAPAVTISGLSSVAFESAYTLNLAATDPGHALQGWSINWGDGVITSLPGDAATATHSFGYQLLPFNITAALTDDVGTYASNSVSVTVSAPLIHSSQLVMTSSTPLVGAAGATFSLTFSNADGIDIATAGQSTVYVTGPNGYQQTASVLGTGDVSPTSVTLLFSVSSPATQWAANDNGTYTIFALPPASSDPLGIASPQTMNTFAIAIARTDSAGNTMAAAKNFGRVAPGFSATLSDSVGPFDALDFYRLQVTKTEGVSYNVSGLIDDVTVQLLNSRGTVVDSQSAGAGGQISFHGILKTGIYFVKVSAAGATGTDYAMSLSATVPPIDHAGNGLAQARNLGTIGPKSNITLTDSVNPFDLIDVYRVSVARNLNLSLNISGLIDGVRVQILRSNGAVIADMTPNSAGTVSYSNAPAAGVYYIRIVSAGDAAANYTLHAGATAAPRPTRGKLPKPVSGLFSSRPIVPALPAAPVV